MRSIYALLFVGLVFFGSYLQSDEIDWDNNLIVGIEWNASTQQIQKFGKIDMSAILPEYGYATRPSKFNSPIPLGDQIRVRLTALLQHSKHVSLSKGSLSIPPGLYQLVYGVNLKNTGGEGILTTWLTQQASHLSVPVTIPLSKRNIVVHAADSDNGFFIVKVFGETFFATNTNCLISIHYSTTGDVILSTLPRFKYHCFIEKKSIFSKPPVPFYLNVKKF